jgi:suppressor of ftsI/bilirubin oxidase
MPNGGPASWPEGSPRRLLTLQVRESARWRGNIPARLSTLTAPAIGDVRQRAFRLGFAKGSWRINDRVFAMDETPIEVARDATEVWLLRNYHASMPHAMHLHGFQFRVLERETSPGALERLAVDDRGRIATDLGWKDTVLIWPGESVRIAIDFRHPFPGTQTYMFHCHNLEHEDGGMMLRMKVG